MVGQWSLPGTALILSYDALRTRCPFGVKPPGVHFQILTSLPPYTDEDNTVGMYFDTLGSLSMVTQCTFWSFPQSLGDCQVLWLEWALVGQVSVVHLSDDPVA